MPLPPRLDRLWLWLIGISFLIITPLWIALWYTRHPALGIIQAGLIGWRVTDWITAPPPTTRGPGARL